MTRAVIQQAAKPATYTRGPWRWELNPSSKSVSICGSNPDRRWLSPYDFHLMTFDRYGMRGASPAFVDASGIIHRADAFAVPAPGRDHHSDWFRLIDHPDAHLIAAAPVMREALDLVWQMVKLPDVAGPAVARAIALSNGGAA